MSDNPAISAHIGLLAESQGDRAIAGTADAASENGRNTQIIQYDLHIAIMILTASCAGQQRCGPCRRVAWFPSS